MYHHYSVNICGHNPVVINICPNFKGYKPFKSIDICLYTSDMRLHFRITFDVIYFQKHENKFSSKITHYGIYLLPTTTCTNLEMKINTFTEFSIHWRIKRGQFCKSTVKLAGILITWLWGTQSRDTLTTPTHCTYYRRFKRWLNLQCQ